MRTFRRLEVIKFLSIRRFQKLLAAYFITATIVVFLYLCFHGSDVSSATRAGEFKSRDRDDGPLIMELNDSDGDVTSRDELLRKIEQHLRIIASQNAVSIWGGGV